MQTKITYMIKNLNHEIMRYCHTLNEDKNMPTPAQMQIIHFIIQNENKVYQKDIAKSLNLRRATLSEILKTMEKKGLITKTSPKEDTRTKQIILSKSTLEKFNEMKKSLNKAEKTIIKNISDKDLDNFLKVIKQMQENLKKERMNI